MSANKKIILLVEDEESMRRVLKGKLEHAGFVSIEAKDGAEALVLAKEKHPDLILLDIIMPRMDGVVMLQELRKDSWGKDVPIMVLTNLGEDWETSEFIKKDVDSYLVKADCTLEDIVDKIKGKFADEGK